MRLPDNRRARRPSAPPRGVPPRVRARAMDGLRNPLGNQLVIPGYGVIPGVAPSLNPPGGVLPGLSLTLGHIPEGLGLSLQASQQLASSALPGEPSAGAQNPLALPDAGVQIAEHHVADPRGGAGVGPSRPRWRCAHPGCDKAFAWPQDLHKHVRKQHSGEAPRFACAREGCGKRFFERKLLVAHERVHTDERPFACQHPGCDKRFRARNALAYHVKATHAAREQLRCQVPGCGFATRRRDAFAAHASRHQRRDAEREWRAKAKGEVQAAVKSAKDDLKKKSADLAAAQKALAAEQRAHAKAKKELEAAKAKWAARSGGGQGGAGSGGGSGLPGGGGGGGGIDGGVGAGGKRARDAYEGGAGASSPPLDEPEVILLDGPDGKVPMLVLNDADDLAGEGEGEGVVGVPGGVVPGVPGGVGRSAAPPPLVVGVGGVPRRLRPVCDQALPWSASFIGCPGIRCRGAGAASLGVDLTPLFAPDGTRLGGARSSRAALEVSNPTDPEAFVARDAAMCPWSRRNARRTFAEARDPVALRAVMARSAPAKPLKVKRVDGQCAGCYRAHVALLAAARRHRKAKAREREEAEGV